MFKKTTNKGKKNNIYRGKGQKAVKQFEMNWVGDVLKETIKKTERYDALTQPGAVAYCVLEAEAEKAHLDNKEKTMKMFEKAAGIVAASTPRSNQEGAVGLGVGAMMGTAVGVLADSLSLGTVSGIGAAVGTVTVLKRLSEDPNYGTELGLKLHPYVQKGKDGFSTAKDWVCGLFTKKAPA